MVRNDSISEKGKAPKGLLGLLARAKKLREATPAPVRRFLRRFINRDRYLQNLWLALDPYRDAEEVSTYPARVEVRLGIIKEFTHAHKDYIGACRELGVPYRLIDISTPDWIEKIEKSGCDAFLVRPSARNTLWKQMFDERLRVMTHDMGKIIYPSYDEIWFYESKRRMHYWLTAHGIPHPRTWVFYGLDEALEFARTCPLPIVYKMNLGSAGSGVRILRLRGDVVRLIRRAFRKGLVRRDGDALDRQWGNVLFQEYLPGVKEWRVPRLGDSFFGHQKVAKGDFHSGSGEVAWLDPPRALLDFAWEISQTGHFTSMDMDIFETEDGRFLVNELQSLFGSSRPWQMRVNDIPGRYLYINGQWRFEEGDFVRNHCANIRVETLLRQIGKPVSEISSGER